MYASKPPTRPFVFGSQGGYKYFLADHMTETHTFFKRATHSHEAYVGLINQRLGELRWDYEQWMVGKPSTFSPYKPTKKEASLLKPWKWEYAAKGKKCGKDAVLRRVQRKRQRMLNKHLCQLGLEDCE